MTAYRTEQELFWAGTFGADYAARNAGTSDVVLPREAALIRMSER